ncbi:Hypothetical protein A7982_08601 [Minicystis rosea]|nr:Hypothetical protein A7982_08601 [Minicystis rosea]
MPLTVEACLDGQCVTATVDLGSSNTNGSDCNVSAQGTACCTITTPVAGVSCLATVGGPVAITFPLLNGASSASHTLEGTIRDKDGTKIFSAQKAVTIATFQPNGPDCEPTCHQGEASFGAN